MNKIKNWSMGLVIIGVLFMSGCATVGGDYGSVVTEGQKAAIVKGKTTKTDILRELGNPDQKIDLGGGKEQFSYIKETIKSTGVIFSLTTSSQRTEFWIIFTNGVVSDFGERPTTKAPTYFKQN
ncbi:MAG: hypothetical protein KKH11_00390 [Candidatus Omnitrophica bacterium]|nr:hypothetical protein [Candidatus Omnitrophota bacterium]